MNDTQCSGPSERPKTPGRKLPQVGNIISWGTLGGERHRGRVIEMDSNVAHVACDDGKRRCVEC